MASTSVVLPWSTCAMIARFLRSVRCCDIVPFRRWPQVGHTEWRAEAGRNGRAIVPKGRNPSGENREGSEAGVRPATGQPVNHLTREAYSKRRVTSNGFLRAAVSQFAILAGLSIRLGHH